MVKLVQNLNMTKMRLKVGINESRDNVFFTDGPWISHKAWLLVDGIVENASKKLLEMKFGVFGSIGKVEFLTYKNTGKFLTRQRS